jgi:hypothetical protein
MLDSAIFNFAFEDGAGFRVYEVTHYQNIDRVWSVWTNQGHTRVVDLFKRRNRPVLFVDMGLHSVQNMPCSRGYDRLVYTAT